MTDDRDLLSNAARGDASAWRALLDLHGPYVFGLAEAHLRRAGAEGIQAEDLLQEIWAGLLASSGRDWAPVEDLRSYLSASVMNAVRKHLRESSRRRARETLRRPAPPPEAPDEPLLRTERAEAVEEALVLLEPQERLLLMWIYWDGLSYARVAGLCGRAENGIGPLLSEVREKLRQNLERKKVPRGPGATGSPFP